MKKYSINNALKFWYLPLIAGILHISLGIWAFLTPIGSFLALTVFLSIGIAAAGLLELIYAFSNRKSLTNWGWHLIGGLLNLIVGICLVSNPGISALMLSVFIGVWLLFRSIMATINAFEVKRQGERKWGWLLAAGISGVLFSAMILWNPVFMGVAIGLWMGVGLVILGIIHIALAMILRKLKTYQERSRSGFNDYIEI
ncbi:HdeD family acid-resistance protein [Parapedobacter deserti]|uniref:HdeD family acid-resistance protein n=1 Tax=Parapedobacter deserti TaxID=1912957 RepID=A0ABV7JMD5_9SPHI